MKRELLLAAAALVAALGVAEGVARLPGISVGHARILTIGDAPVRTVDGVELWQERYPRAGPEDIARAAAAHDAFTVLGLGDSIMYGVSLPKEQTYLEQMRRAVAGRTGRRVEVVNLAVPGYNTRQEDAVHRELADRLAPNLVLLHYWSDDAHMYRVVGGYVVDVGELSPDGSLVVRTLPIPQGISDFLFVHSHLYQLLTQAMAARDQRAAAWDWSQVVQPLVALDERVRKAGGRLVVLASPDLAADTVRANTELPALRELGAEHGFEVIDLSTWLDGAPAPAIRIDPVHFNTEGHRRIGEHLATYVLAHDLH